MRQPTNCRYFKNCKLKIIGDQQLHTTNVQIPDIVLYCGHTTLSQLARSKPWLETRIWGNVAVYAIALLSNTICAMLVVKDKNLFYSLYLPSTMNHALASLSIHSCATIWSFGEHARGLQGCIWPHICSWHWVIVTMPLLSTSNVFCMGWQTWGGGSRASYWRTKRERARHVCRQCELGCSSWIGTQSDMGTLCGLTL